MLLWTCECLALQTDCIYTWRLSVEGSGEVKWSEEWGLVLLVLSFTLMHLATAVTFRANSESWPTAGLFYCLKLLSVANKDSLFQFFFYPRAFSLNHRQCSRGPSTFIWPGTCFLFPFALDTVVVRFLFFTEQELSRVITEVHQQLNEVNSWTNKAVPG